MERKDFFTMFAVLPGSVTNSVNSGVQFVSFIRKVTVQVSAFPSGVGPMLFTRRNASITDSSNALSPDDFEICGFKIDPLAVISNVTFVYS